MLTEHNYKLVTKHYFQLTFVCETAKISFEARLFPKLPSELVITESVLKKLELSPLSYGIVGVNKRFTYVTNGEITSRLDCVF